MVQNTSGDPRARRTRKALQETFKTLVQLNGYEAVTVQELAAKAAVNRATFYLHYRDKEDLLDSIISDLLAPSAAEIDGWSRGAPDWQAQEPPNSVVDTFERIGREAGFYRHMLGRNGSPLFVERLLTHLEQMLLARLAQLPPLPGTSVGVPTSLALRHLVFGQLGVLIWWLEHDRPRSAQEMARWCWALQGFPAEPAKR